MAAPPARILVVEDEALVAAMLGDMLEELGAVVAGTAVALEAACDLARTADCHAAVLDVTLRGESVAPVARILAGRGIPFVLATGYAGRAAEEWPGAPVMEKPYSVADLACALRRLGVGVGGWAGR